MKSKPALKRISKSNKPLMFVILFLLVFGLLIIYNSTAYYAQATFGNAFRFVYLQLIWIFFGLLGFTYFSNKDYHKIKGISFLLFFISLFFLIILAFVGLLVCRDPGDVGVMFAPCINGASRWFYFNPGPLPQLPLLGTVGLQPGELAKLSVILYLSYQLHKFESTKVKGKDPFYLYLTVSLLVAFLLLLQPNMSTAVLIFIIGSVVYYISGNTLLPMFISTPLILFSGFLVVLTSDYRRARLMTLLGFNSDGGQDVGYHIKQIMIALGSGGLFGLGFGQSRQKFQYLPEVASDSIFAIIGEEFGFLGTSAIILIFGYLLYLGFNISKNAPDSLGKMLSMGVTSWIAFQFFINIAAMTKLLPLTGMPIPLISYGGSSMVFTLIGLGIVNNIHKQGKDT